MAKSAASAGAAAPKQPAKHWVAEGGLRFAVEFSEHLDTGLFLDHRPTRQMLRELAVGKKALNLFAYTGTASVCMAAGRAASVHTVDLSNTYLQWAKENMRQNGFQEGGSFSFEQADVLRWAADKRHDRSAERYGLIFCDPPTFSNSKSMGVRTWCIDDGHAELLITLSRLLLPGGQIVFGANSRRFKLDADKLARAHVGFKDVTAQTIPEDFKKPAGQHPAHRCYLLSRE